MHTLKVAVLDTSSPAVPYTAEQFARSLDERLHLLPSFRWRLVETPMGLHHPVWVEDPIFDINRHVYRWTAQAPGGSKEMDEAIGRVASTPLLHDRPLWELHLIEGLADARVAAVAKIHHAMADGGAPANQLLNVAELFPGGPIVANVPAATGQRPDRLFGNSVGLMFTGLPVHLPDRRARLDFIHRGVLAARKASELAGPELLDEWLEYVPPKPFAWFSNFYARSKLV